MTKLDEFVKWYSRNHIAPLTITHRNSVTFSPLLNTYVCSFTKTPLTLKNRISYTLKPTGDTFLVLVNLESFVFYVFAIKEIRSLKG